MARRIIVITSNLGSFQLAPLMPSVANRYFSGSIEHVSKDMFGFLSRIIHERLSKLSNKKLHSGLAGEVEPRSTTRRVTLAMVEPGILKTLLLEEIVMA